MKQCLGSLLDHAADKQVPKLITTGLATAERAFATFAEESCSALCIANGLDICSHCICREVFACSADQMLQLGGCHGVVAIDIEMLDEPLVEEAADVDVAVCFVE